MFSRIFLFFFSLSLFAQIPFTQFVVFGDSLSDNGNLYIGTSLLGIPTPGPPLYATGEYTDGANSVPATTGPLGLWIEQLATKMNLPVPQPFLKSGTNYAVASAHTGSDPGYSPTSLSVPYITDQLNLFLSANHTPPVNALYTFWGGADDILNGGSATAAVSNIQANINTLAAAGAKYFLWVNLPPLGEVPENINTSSRASLDADSVAFNSAWTSAIAQLTAAHPGIAIVTVDAYALFQATLQNPSLYGYTNVTSPAQGVTGVNPNTYLFWDGLHPTTAADAYIANAAYNSIQAAFGGPALLGAANAASGAQGAVSPGMLTLIEGSNIGPAALAPAQLDSATNLAATTLASTQVFFNKIAAPLFYVQSGQIVAVAPYEIANLSSVEISVVHNGVASASFPISVAPSVPGIFSANYSGSGPGAIYNQDLTYNSASNPAAAGTIIVFFGTGEGQTNPAGIDGIINTSSFPKPALPVTVTIGGQPAQIIYDGAIPDQIAGLLQINARVPAGLASGPQPVVVTIGTASSQANLTVAVK
jgi:uncharacterized protein (TIGR03437 family)